MTGYFSHNDFIQRGTAIVESKLDNEQFGVSELAREMGMSRSNLHRSVKSALNKSASQFIREIRLQKARELLKDPSYTVSEIAFRVGFGSSTYFSKCFHEYYGFPPGQAGEHLDDNQASKEPFLKNELIGRGKKSLNTRILITSLILIAFAIILLVILKPFSFQSENRGNSIAVMPFINDSPDEAKMYFINGTMEAILNNLCKIEDLRVVPRNSVEQYRDHPKPTRVVAREMNVDYLLEGSGHRDGNNVRLYVQLIDGRNDRHIWSKSYEADLENIFLMQGEIAQLVAGEIKASVTTEEKELIEKIPTTNLTAYDYYLRGYEEIWNYWLDNQNIEALEKARNFFNNALKYDTAYANAYCGLAMVYLDRNFWNTLFSWSFGDSVLIYANKALLYDDQLADAYCIRGRFYYHAGQENRAIKELDIATKHNPNEGLAYLVKARILRKQKDFPNSIENCYKAASLFRGKWLINTLKQLGWVYSESGFYEKAIYYHEQAFTLDGDSVGFYWRLADSEYEAGNHIAAINNLNKAYAIDSINIYILGSLAAINMRDRQYSESLKYYRKYMESIKALEQYEYRESYDNLGIAYVLLQNGFKEEADMYFEKVMNFEQNAIKYERKEFLGDAYYRLAAIYAIHGDKDKAIENLLLFSRESGVSSKNLIMKTDPWWDILRDEPAFQQIIKDWEDTFQTKHEKVRIWLQENEML